MESGILERIRQRLDEVGLSPRAASLASGLSQDAIRKLLKNENSPTLETVEKLALGLRTTPEWLAYAVGGRSMAEENIQPKDAGERIPGLREDGERYQPPLDDNANRVAAALAALEKGRSDAWTYVLRTRVLELIGIRPGDILVVERREAYRSGDIVCVAAAYGENEFETLFRIYQHPFIVPAYADPLANRPRLLDDDGTFAIHGAVTEVLRVLSA